MTGLDFIENINYVDDDLIFEAESWVRPKTRKIGYAVGAGILAACLCLTIGLKVNHSKEENLLGCNEIVGGGSIFGEIYPTIMVNGELYEWLFGKAIVNELPVGSTYYGKIRHTDGATPQKDCEFVSDFPANGRVFLDRSENLVYLELTTDWLEKQLVIFEPTATSERYQYEMGLLSQE